MQNICHFSRRWHQQFCHSLSFGPHRHCLRALVHVRGYRQGPRGTRQSRQDVTASQTLPPEADKTHGFDPFSPSQLFSRDGNDLIVREFEQHGSNKSTRKAIVPDKELRDETEEVWAEIQDVEKKLKVMRQGPFGPQSEFMKRVPPEQREEVMKVLAEAGFKPEDEEDALDLAEIDRLMEEDKQNVDEEDTTGVTLHIPRSHQALVRHFNKALMDTKDNEDNTLKILNLWKWYLRCQQKIPAFSNIISESVWDTLWSSQSKLKVRQNHLVLLGRHMLAADEVMNKERDLEYIQALQACGDCAEALVRWEARKSDINRKSKPAFLTAFFTTGVQLYAEVGRSQKAQSEALAAIDKGADPQLLLHVISSWSKSKAPGSATKAWTTYLRMRALLGEDMQPELYEKVSDTLLDKKQSELALAVFKDMIVRLKGSGINTLESYRKALGRVDLEDNPENIESAINEVSLNMLLALPKQYQNKFFFASWIKKLLGQQRTEAASLVVDLMYERNIKPDAIHLNGLVGAWLRESTAQSREKAETLADQMIQARINHVAEAAQNKSVQEFGNVFRKVMPVNETRNVWKKAIRLERPVPAANLETFSILFDYYEQRHKWQEYERLTQVMIGPAQVKPNAFIMNKWLAAELRARSLSRFWTLFNKFKGYVLPNVETYGLAWQALVLQHTSPGSTPTLSHRQLFAEMTRWAQGLNARQRKTAKQDFEIGFHAEIVRSFCYQLDLPGTICALQGMYGWFEATPDDVSVRLITGMAARILPRSVGVGGRRKPNTKTTADQNVLKGIAEIIDTFEAQKKIELAESGKAKPEELEDNVSSVSKSIRLEVMVGFLIMVMHRVKKPGDNPVKTLRDVARVMRVNIDHINMEVPVQV